MGIFSTIKALMQSAKAGGNFGFIAQNVACINHIIKNSEISKDFTDDQILYATALIDTYSYIMNGVIGVEEIEQAVVFAKAGIVSVNFVQNAHGMMDSFECRTLLNLTLQLEALIFTYSTNNDANSVINMVLEEKNKIRGVIDKTIKEGSSCNIYKDLAPMVYTSLSDPDFISMVMSYNENN